MRTRRDPYSDPVILQIHNKAMEEREGRMFHPCKYSRAIAVQCRCWSEYHGDGEQPTTNCLFECTSTPLKFGQQKLG